MGLQNKNMRDACEQSDVSFVAALQGLAYKTARCIDDRHI